MLLTGGVLLAAAVWDGRRREIPHLFPAALLLLAMLRHGNQPEGWLFLLAGLLLTGGPLLLLALRQDACGGGDVKLAAALGALLGPSRGLLLTALALALLLAWGRLRRQAGALLFAPFLFGAWLCLSVVEVIPM